MKTKKFAPVGSLHPVLFFAILYLVALIFFVFFFSLLFYSCAARPVQGYALPLPGGGAFWS